ncbi:2406_t:CDS:2 [Acaulospora morrowiae]|uniref:2406_t:CDS:1 n=1 Tax=Acaulospora morrowiae TaxID=94023 RepID=A0A9N9F9U0_9GLOM|nr:2406_t:CDS:2 [Acaulospora morrowiae]
MGYVVEQGLHLLDFIDENVGHIIGESFGSLDVAENTDVAKETSYIEEESLSLLGIAENTSHIIGESLSSLGAAKYTGHISLNLLNQYYVVYRIEESNKLTSVRFIDKEVLNMPNIHKLVQKRICLKCRKLFNYPSQLKIHIKSHSGEKLYCRYKDCKTSFTFEHNRRRHEKWMHCPKRKYESMIFLSS